MATVGELIVKLTASTASFASDMGKATQISFDSAKSIERSFKVIGAEVVAGLTSAGAAVEALALRSIDNADKMGKAAQAAGTTVESFSALSYAAKISNVDVGVLSNGLGFLARNLEKSNQATLEGKAANQALSTIFRGNIPVFQSTDEAFKAIAERIALMPDGLQKTALATQIFGRGAQSLIPLLNQGATGIEKMRAEAEQLGVVVSDKTAKSAERFNDQVQRIKAAIEGFGLRLAEALLPYMNQLADRLLDATKNAAEMQGRVQLLAETVKILANGVITLVYTFKGLGDAIAYSLSPLVIATDGWDAYKVAANESGRAVLDDLKAIARAWEEPTQKARTFGDIMDDLSRGLRQPGHALGPSLGNIVGDSDKKVQQIVESLREQVAQLGLSTAEAKAFDVAMAEGVSITQARNRALQGGTTELEKQAFQLGRQLDFYKSIGNVLKPNAAPAFNPAAGLPPDITQNLPNFEPITTGAKELDAAMKAYAASLNQQDRPALEKYNEQLQLLQFLHENAGLSTEAFNAEVKKLNDGLKQTGPIAVAVRQAMDEMFTQAIFRANSFGEALSNILERIAEMIFQVKVLDPLLNKLFNINPATGQSNGGSGILGSIFGALGGLFGGGSYSLGAPNPGGFDPLGIGTLPLLASGGDLNMGQAAIVGERGPELFVPNVAGRIIPNGVGGSSFIFAPQIDARNADAGVEQRILRIMRNSLETYRKLAVKDMRELQRRTV